MTRTELESLGFYRGMQPAADNVYSSPVGVSNGRTVTSVCEVDLGRKGDRCTIIVNGRLGLDDPKATLVDVLRYYREGLRELPRLTGVGE